MDQAVSRRHPEWLRVRLPGGENYNRLKVLVRDQSLHTVCEEARCPNIGECWSRGTATFMILGDICTRSCGFCAVTTGRPTDLDSDEPRRVAEAVRRLGLKHAVITSVNRDELADGGAAIWAATVRAVRELAPDCRVEVLVPDFKGIWWALDLVLETRPDVFAHNLETVPRLSREVRPQARYDQSLEVIARARSAGLRTKSGLMLGLGETSEEILAVMADLRDAGCDVLTLGQYLQPTRAHLKVESYIAPDTFRDYAAHGRSLGFAHVEAGPLVRSSYHAEMHVG